MNKVTFGGTLDLMQFRGNQSYSDRVLKINISTHFSEKKIMQLMLLKYFIISLQRSELIKSKSPNQNFKPVLNRFWAPACFKFDSNLTGVTLKLAARSRDQIWSSCDPSIFCDQVRFKIETSEKRMKISNNINMRFWTWKRLIHLNLLPN